MLQVPYTNNRGMATLIALIMVGMLTLIGIAAVSTSDDEVKVAGNDLQATRAFYAAESGLDIAAAGLVEEFELNGMPPATMPEGSDEINGCTVKYEAKKTASGERKVLSNGNLAGLYGAIDSYAAISVGTDNLARSSVELAQTFEAALVPIFQFAVFYNDDLEFSPGADMTLIGRIHSNGDMYLQSKTTLKMDSYVSANGNIFHGRKSAGVVSEGDVQIKNAKGQYESMKQGSDWLDSKDAWWKDSSLARWNGRVKDDAHDQKSLDMNLTSDDDPRNLIEPAAGNPDSYENKASLKFINNQAYEYQSGSWVNVTANMTALGVITNNPDKFYDQREADLVEGFELYFKKLYDCGYGPDNGVIYYHTDAAAGEYPALRLINGEEVGAPLTIATDNPVYTLGNFNTTNKQPVSILSDALTFLSANWDDTKGALLKTDRPAANTTVNCSYITGAGESSALTYGGGFENLVRLLEDWSSNRTLTWTGSAAKMWESMQANGLFGNAYFNEPKRNWKYDSNLDDPNNLPPESPVARVFQRTGWKQQYVGYKTEIDSL